MISISTWLAVTVPVLTALIGVGGTLLAGRANRRTADRGADVAREDEQRRWNRERRKEAYVASLEATDRIMKAIDNVGPLQCRPSSLKSLPQQLDQSAATVTDAFVAVELFGSKPAYEAAVAWAENLRNLIVTVNMLSDAAGLRERQPLGGDAAYDLLLPQFMKKRHNVYELRSRFLRLLRAELGITSG